ncbi:hypothetical protein QBC39DRAFT_171360 [Podospora conica]|nr:hypothetical protein QBC39DRAFT_171360 [Schizothecium conicum]
MVRLNRGSGRGGAWLGKECNPAWSQQRQTDKYLQTSICCLNEWHRQRLPSRQEHIFRPMASIDIVGGRVVVRCSRKDADDKQGLVVDLRRELVCCRIRLRAARAHWHRIPVVPKLKLRRRGKTKASASRRSDQSHVVATPGPIFGSPPGVASASPAPPVPPVAIARRQSRRKMRALHWSSCLSPPSKTNLLAICHPHPPRTKPTAAEPIPSSTYRCLTRISCYPHLRRSAGELLSGPARVN